MSTFIEHQNWRYATKKFDTSKKVSNSDLQTLKKAIQLAASAYGLQPYKVLIVENPELRTQLQTASWGQSQIVEASHLLVFANISKIDEAYIDAFFENTANTRNIPIEALDGYKTFMKNAILNMPEDQMNIWTSKQTYLALGNLLCAAAELKIDVTPMEGFEAQKYNDILGLSAKGLNASLVATIGYRHEEDQLQHLAKVRKPETELFETI
ncbi:NAD(P)H-dependent oxidoreductase [Flavobacterium sp. 20NA77.7]|uniref:NAD(P)H-dependent oxidoreductase n=1 Tax=Flavobacterium nakdongensis TaxID=3073563 RepID=A0ABY9RBN3_9FLAO|nr:NAD(P)H-dependent oxidoreductase [Flavobacterium sp. 20NA77.7]WMW78653.1 NAD(P)H-dependent oxidoreductase [Flavobacterium sp. 20NA77.7]